MWRRVCDLLEAKGHRVFTPTLTGVGERSHLLSENIRLETHIADVVNLLVWEDLTDVVLVGHSYGGWVVTGAAEKVSDRLRGLIYLDAFLPLDGQRGMDVLNEQQIAAFNAARDAGDLSRPGPTSAGLKIQRPEDAVWVDSKITPQPIGVSLDPIRLTGAVDKVGRKLYVRAPLFPQPRFDEALERCRSDASWQTMILNDCGHDPMVDDPQATAELMMSIA
ncbi:hypothetical protein H009_11976 [Agrobacterium tumefaciens str. Cherry 2E-2-2]|nr:hypothetical protein H009_11976 [Agrobacterium tumefaciens str. Cherry 2E-2-2]